MKKEKHGPIRLRDFAKWVIKNNLEISSYYTGSNGHIPINSRVENHDRKFKNVIHNLQCMSLIGVVGTQKAEKSKEMIPVYGYTEEGVLIAYLISYIEKEKEMKKSNLDKMLDIIQRLLSRYDSYIADFVVRLYANAREKGFSEA